MRLLTGVRGGRLGRFAWFSFGATRTARLRCCACLRVSLLCWSWSAAAGPWRRFVYPRAKPAISSSCCRDCLPLGMNDPARRRAVGSVMRDLKDGAAEGAERCGDYQAPGLASGIRSVGRSVGSSWKGGGRDGGREGTGRKGEGGLLFATISGDGFLAELSVGGIVSSCLCGIE